MHKWQKKRPTSKWKPMSHITKVRVFLVFHFSTVYLILHVSIRKFSEMQALEIERMLAAAAEEERRMKEFQMKQMRDSWESELTKKRAEAARDKGPDFDPMHSGPSSLQVLEGEDPQRTDRIRKQQQQMRDWIQEQIAEKEYTKQLDLEDEMNYAELIRTIDEIREATDMEEREMRRYIHDTIKLENLEVLAACYSFP